MKDKFNDIFDTINLLHKKYNSQEYLQKIENFKEDSEDLVQILEKYKVAQSPSNKKQKEKLKDKKEIQKRKKYISKDRS